MNRLRCSKCGQLKSLKREHNCFHNKTIKCNLCGQFKSKNHKCSFTYLRSKGMKEYREIVNYFLALDRSRNVSLNVLSKRYKIDKSGIRNRIKTYMRNS